MSQYTLARQKLNDLLDHVNDGYARNTLRAYRADMEEFINYCEVNGSSPLPADPFVLAEFLIKATDDGIKASTIRRKVSSISAVHRLSYLNDPTKHPEVKIAVRKVNRKLGTRFKQAYPINRDLLERMLAVCGGDLQGLRDRMLLLIAYESLRRRSELVSLRIEDLVIATDGASTILLRDSKTDQTSEGFVINFGQRTTAAIRDWLTVSGLREGPLLRGLRNGHITTGYDSGQIGRTFKRIARVCGVDEGIAKRISGHSTRVGSAQDLLLTGESLAQIMARVGWTKVDTVMRYVGLTPMQALMRGAPKQLSSLSP